MATGGGGGASLCRDGGTNNDGGAGSDGRVKLANSAGNTTAPAIDVTAGAR
jgi:hypothetical protein